MERNLYTLNVGLDRNDGRGRIDTVAVVERLGQLGFSVLRAQVRESSTEPTLVVRMVDRLNTLPYIKARMDGLAREFQQDCVAIRLDESRHPVEFGDFHMQTFCGNGLLIGPKAHEWGTFQPEFFLDYSAN